MLDERSMRIATSRNRDFSKVQSNIVDSEAFLRGMERLGRRGSHWGFDMVVLKFINDEKTRLRALRDYEFALKEAMNPELNKPTMALEPVVAPDTPVNPNVRRILLFAVLAGFILGLLLVTLRSINDMNGSNVCPEHWQINSDEET